MNNPFVQESWKTAEILKYKKNQVFKTSDFLQKRIHENSPLRYTSVQNLTPAIFFLLSLKVLAPAIFELP